MTTTWVNGVSAVQPSSAGSLVAIGNFDGVHRGHQAVLRRAVDTAKRQGFRPTALTFHPHPSEVLQRATVSYLTRLERKAELIGRIDPGLLVVVEPFTKRLARLDPEAFVRECLVDRLNAKWVIVGENFRFGRDRSGGFQELQQFGRRYGFEAHVESLNHEGGEVISSSRIRDAIAAGDVAAAARLLGRPHALQGRVARGARLGRKLGFPTANLEHVAELLPAHGVYSCLIDRAEACDVQPASGVNTTNDWRALARGVLNVGVRPTVEGQQLAIEAHLFDVALDLYDQELRVHLVNRLRPEQKFDSLDALVQQIARDSDRARRELASVEPDPEAATAWA